jgi:hypothetical protein
MPPTLTPTETPVPTPQVALDRVDVGVFEAWVSSHHADIEQHLATDLGDTYRLEFLGLTLGQARWDEQQRPEACYVKWMTDWNRAVSDLDSAVDGGTSPAWLPYKAALAEYRHASTERPSGPCDRTTPTGPAVFSNPAPPPVFRAYANYPDWFPKPTTHPDWLLAVYSEFERGRAPLEAAVDAAQESHSASQFAAALQELSDWDLAFSDYVQWEVVPSDCYQETARSIVIGEGDSAYALANYARAISTGNKKNISLASAQASDPKYSNTPAQVQVNVARWVAGIATDCGLETTP